MRSGGEVGDSAGAITLFIGAITTLAGYEQLGLSNILDNKWDFVLPTPCSDYTNDTDTSDMLRLYKSIST